MATLTKRKRAQPTGPAHPAWWAVAAFYQRGRTRIEPGRTLTIKGQRGCEFRFVRHVTNTRTGADWIDVVGGSTRLGDEKSRSFRPDQIGRVLRPKPVRRAR